MTPPRCRTSTVARVGLIGAVLALLSGCVVGPQYVRPSVVTPDAFKEGQGWTFAHPSDDAIRGAWWEMFGDSTLNALEAQVNVSNQTLAADEAAFREARALVREARAAFFPTVTIGVGYSRSRSSATAVTGSAASATSRVAGPPGGKSDFFQLPIDVSWTPDFWGRVRRTVESQQAAAQASAGDLQTARLSLQAELALNYFQLRTLDAQKRLLDETVAAYTQYLELTRNRYASGVASQVDVVQAEAQLKATQAQAIDVGVQRAQLEHAMALLTGQPASTFSLPATPLSGSPPPIPLGVPSELLQRRPDIAAAERRVAAANAQIGVAIAAFYPTITLSASAGFESTGLAQWLTWPSRFWSVGPSISQTVYDGGLRRAQTDAARAAYDSTVATYRETVLGAFQGVEDNLAALRILEDETGVQADAVKAAQQSVALTTNQYKAGIVSYLNVITTQTTALSDEITFLQLQGRRMTAAVQLIEALGGGWSDVELPTTQQATTRGDRR